MLPGCFTGGPCKAHTCAQMHTVNPGSQPRSSPPERVNLLIHFQSGPQIIWPNPAGVDSILGQRVKWSRDFSQEESITLPSSSELALHLDLTTVLSTLSSRPIPFYMWQWVRKHMDRNQWCTAVRSVSPRLGNIR